MVSEAVQTNGINNGNNVYAPYLVTSSNNLQFKHTQQNIVVISQPHSIPTHKPLPPQIKESLPSVTSRSQMSSQTLANAYNVSEPNYRPQSTTTHNEMHQPSPSTQQQIPSHIANKFPGYKLQVYHIDGGPDSQEQQTHSLQNASFQPNQQPQQMYEGAVPPHQVRMSSQTSTAAKSRASTSMEKKHHPKGSHHTHLHQHHPQHHQHGHHQHAIPHSHHQGKMKPHDVNQQQHHSSPKHRKSHQQDDRKNHNKLQKSRSDGQLLDDSAECHSTDQSSMSIGSHSHAGLRNINTSRQHSARPSSHHTAAQKYTPIRPDFEKRFAQHPPPSCSEEEEISDRDMPALAPIPQQEHQHEHICMMGGGPNFKGNMEYMHATQPCEKHDPSRVIPVQPVSSSYSPSGSNIHSGHTQRGRSQEKATAGYGEDIDRDLGQALSPLGSTSSLQDLIESVSVPSRGDGSSKSEKLIATSLWAEQTRAMHAEQHPVETDLIRTERSVTYPEESKVQEIHDHYGHGNRRDSKERSLETATVPAHQRDEREPSSSSLKSGKSGKKLKTVKVVAPEDMDADSGRGTSEDMHHHHHSQPCANVDFKHDLRRKETQANRIDSEQKSNQTFISNDDLDQNMDQTSSMVDDRIKDPAGTYIEEEEPCIEVEEEATSISLNPQQEEMAAFEEIDDKLASVTEEVEPQQDATSEDLQQNICCTDSMTQSYKEEQINSGSFQRIEEGKGLDQIHPPIQLIDKDEAMEDADNDKDEEVPSKEEEVSVDDNDSTGKEDVTCEDESGLGTTEKDVKGNGSVSEGRVGDEGPRHEEQLKADEEQLSKSPKYECSFNESQQQQDRSIDRREQITNENGLIWQRIQSDRGDVKKKAEAFEEKIKSVSQSSENEQQEKSLPSSLLSGDEDDIKVLKQPQVSKRIEEYVVSPDFARSDDETTSQHVDSEAVFRSSCDEDDLANVSVKREEDEGSVISSIERPSSIDTPQPNVISGTSPPPIAPKPKSFANGLLKDKKNLTTKNDVSNTIPQVTKMPKVTVSSEPSNGVPLVEPPAGFGDSPVKTVKVVEIKDFDMQSDGFESSDSILPQQGRAEEFLDDKPVIEEGMFPKQQFANVEILPNTDIEENIAHQGPTYHRPAEMQIEELTSLSSALEIAPLQTYPSDSQEGSQFVKQKSVDVPDSPQIHSMQKDNHAADDSGEIDQFSAKEQYSSSERKQKVKPRKGSCGSRERSDIVTSSSNASMQSVQVVPEAQAVSSTTPSSTKGKVRSRSSSKERLLSTLANSGDAPVTSHEEDDISGIYITFLYKECVRIKTINTCR